MVYKSSNSENLNLLTLKSLRDKTSISISIWVSKSEREIKNMKTVLMFLVLLFCINTVYSFPTRRELLTHAQFKRMMEASETSESNELFERNFRTGRNQCRTEKECHDFKEDGISKRVCIEIEEITCR